VENEVLFQKALPFGTIWQSLEPLLSLLDCSHQGPHCEHFLDANQGAEAMACLTAANPLPPPSISRRIWAVAVALI
jgi:hypothetical protein